MTTDQVVLARRAVASPKWRWLPGMLALVPPADDGFTGYMRRISSTMDQPPARAYPDLVDHAAAGCLLEMLVAAEPDAGWGVSCGPDVGWRATSCEYDLSGCTSGSASRGVESE